MIRVDIGLNRTLVGLALVAGLLWLASSLSSVIFELLAALGIAYIFDPVVDRLERRVRSRGVAILLLLVPLLALGVLIFGWLVPRLVEEVRLFVVGLPEMLEVPFIWARDQLTLRFHVAMPETLEEVVSRFGADIRSSAPQVLSALKEALGSLFSGGYGVFRLVTSLLLIPIFAVYLLYDFDRIVAYLHGLVPRRYEPVVTRHVVEIDRAVAGFFRGQLTVCLILGTLYSIGYSLVGVKLALVIGLGTGLMAVVPYAGALIGFVTAMTFTVIAFVSGNATGWQVLGTVIVFAAVQALDGTMITPRVLGKSVNLSPILILIALMVGGTLFGFIGVLIAVPVAASLRVVGHSLIEAYRTSQFYEQGLACVEPGAAAGGQPLLSVTVGEAGPAAAPVTPSGAPPAPAAPPTPAPPPAPQA